MTKIIPIVPAENFVETLRANVDNAGLTDAEFREFVRDTLTIVSSTHHPCTGQLEGVRVDYNECRVG